MVGTRGGFVAWRRGLAPAGHSREMACSPQARQKAEALALGLVASVANGAAAGESHVRPARKIGLNRDVHHDAVCESTFL
jgi:hypothetical protein